MSEPTVPPPPSYTPPPPPSGPAGGASDNRSLMLVLSYIPPLCLIPWLTEKEDREVQWHAKNGVVISIFFILVMTAFGIVSSIPFVGCLGFVCLCITGLAWFIVTVLGIMKAFNNERFILPVVSQYADRF